MTLRISTFNCENLLSRARILNFDNDSVARRPLADLAKLDGILSQESYSASDKESILALLPKLKGFVEVKELRKKLLARHRVNGRSEEYVRPDGRAGWVGGLSLIFDHIPTEAQQNTAKVIKEVAADIQCIVEVEDRPTLESFCDQSVLKGIFPYNLVLDGNDQRGIDVGLLSKYPFGRIKTHIFDVDGAPRTKRVFSRDCLEVEVLPPGGESLFMLLNHFKSQGYGSKASNDARRKAQADRVIEILGAYNLAKDLVVVAGDFNDRPENDPVKGLVGLQGLTDVLAKKLPDPKTRWTYKDKSQIDYLLVSQPLADAMEDAGIERRGLLQLGKLTKGAEQSFAGVTSDTNDASDHAAVWAEFSV
jgi:endonuclease/exonuclease/phosphatase family metal-dependent hydrolase